MFHNIDIMRSFALPIFVEENKDKGAHPERWPRGNTYTNNWETPTYMISLEDTTLRGKKSMDDNISAKDLSEPAFYIMIFSMPPLDSNP